MSDGPESITGEDTYAGALGGIVPPHVQAQTGRDTHMGSYADFGTAWVGSSLLALGPSGVGRPSPEAGLPGEGSNTQLAGSMGENVL